jgi:hypothetical protein
MGRFSSGHAGSLRLQQIGPRGGGSSGMVLRLPMMLMMIMVLLVLLTVLSSRRRGRPPSRTTELWLLIRRSMMLILLTMWMMRRMIRHCFVLFKVIVIAVVLLLLLLPHRSGRMCRLAPAPHGCVAVVRRGPSSHTTTEHTIGGRCRDVRHRADRRYRRRRTAQTVLRSVLWHRMVGRERLVSPPLLLIVV